MECGGVIPQTLGVYENSSKIGSLHLQHQIISEELKDT